MEDKKPVALWKGIVGTALSGTILVVLIPFLIIISSVDTDIELWVKVILVVSAIVCTFSLIISIINLSSNANYRRRNAQENEPEKPEANSDNKELLHKLLAEGKITIEEYDKLSGK